MGLDPRGLEESIAKLAEEKKKEEGRRRDEAKKEEEECRMEEERRIAEAKVKEEKEKAEKRKDKKEEPRRVAFQREATPPIPTSPALRAATNGMNTPPSPGRARLASSAMSMKVRPRLFNFFNTQDPCVINSTCRCPCLS